MLTHRQNHSRSHLSGTSPDTDGPQHRYGTRKRNTPLSTQTLPGTSTTSERRPTLVHGATGVSPRTERKLIALVGSSGGHLADMCALHPWTDRHDRLWVTFDKPDSRSRLHGEEVVWAFHPTTRNLYNLVRNIWLAFAVIRKRRPDLIVSSGAGVAFAFFVVARLMRIPTVYVEVYDRVDSPTLTGRLCRPLSTRFFVQWQRQQSFYDGSEVIGPVL